MSVKQYAVGILVVQMYCYIRNTDEWTQGLIRVGMGMHLNLLSFEYHVNVFSLLLSLAPFHTDLKTFSRGSCLRKFTLVLAPPDGRLISLPISKSWIRPWVGWRAVTTHEGPSECNGIFMNDALLIIGLGLDLLNNNRLFVRVTSVSINTIRSYDTEPHSVARQASGQELSQLNAPPRITPHTKKTD